MTARDTLCPGDELEAVLAASRCDPGEGLRALEKALRHFPDDARLHFLKGSLLAAREEYEAARAAMRRAVDLAPDYAIARFQLGLLALSSGEPYAAQEVWGPLQSLPAGHYLRAFVEGLTFLIGDAFDDAIRGLERGIAANAENAPLNRDMQLIIDELRSRSGDDAVSPVGLLLRQSALKARKH